VSKNSDIKKIKTLISKGKSVKALRLISNITNLISLIELGVYYSETNAFITESILERIDNLAPTNATDWSNRGVAFFFLGRQDKAIESLDIAIKLNPNFAGAWANKGRVFERLGIYDEGIKCFDKAIEIGSNDGELADAWSDKGGLLNKLGRYEEALECCEKAIEINTNLENAWSNKGAVLINTKNYPEAIKCFEEAIRLNPQLDKAWANKGLVFQYLRKYDKAIENYEHAIKINPRLENAWLNKGVILFIKKDYKNSFRCFDRVVSINSKNILGVLNKGAVLDAIGEYNDAIACFDRVLEIDSAFSGALSNKAAALLSLERFEEVIELCDKVLKEEPTNVGSLSNKGAALGCLGRIDEAIECFERAIEIDPEYPGGYMNLGIAFLNLYAYDRALGPFRKARELLMEINQVDGANETKKYEIWSLNASKLLLDLKPIDEEFIVCLSSQSLIKLRESCSHVFNNLSTIIDNFAPEDLPVEAWELLYCKIDIYSALLSALNFQKIDLTKLEMAKELFEKWGFSSLIIEVNSIDTFIRKLNSYKNLENISKSEEERILHVLKNIHILENRLTDEIFDKFKVKFKQGLPPQPGENERLILEPIQVIRNLTDECIRINLVQLDINLTEKFPYHLNDEKKVKERIFSAIELAKKNKVEIICFPELSFSGSFIDHAKEYKDIIIIGGSYYKNNFNVCPVIISGEEYPVYKIHPSPQLESRIAPGKGMNSGKDIKIFKTIDKKFSFSVLICMDYLRESWRLHHQLDERDRVNIIFNPQFNSDVSRFQRLADTECENYHTNIMQINVTNYGGTCIIGIEDKKIISRFISEGFRNDDSITYKICEVNKGEESSIIMDINVNVGIIKPTPLNAMPRMNIIGRYRYDNETWIDIDSN
jgi:tetratricopeptide (TPR) repeat protein/predicted amidohydrolase